MNVSTLSTPVDLYYSYMKKMSDAIDDMVAYTQLTDYIYQQILFSMDENLQEVLHHDCVIGSVCSSLVIPYG